MDVTHRAAVPPLPLPVVRGTAQDTRQAGSPAGSAPLCLRACIPCGKSTRMTRYHLGDCRYLSGPPIALPRGTPPAANLQAAGDEEVVVAAPCVQQVHGRPALVVPRRLPVLRPELGDRLVLSVGPAGAAG